MSSLKLISTVNPMDISLFSDFLAVVHEGNFLRASQRRAISQSALSRRIQALEEEIGATLLIRNKHAVTLTEAGEAFKRMAEDLSARLANGENEIRRIATKSPETVRFAATHVLSLNFFPSWLCQLQAHLDELDNCQLTADHMVACERLMLEGKVQFLLYHHHPLVPTVIERAPFEHLCLGRDSLVPVAAPSLIKKAKDKKQWRQLPWLAYSEKSGMGRILRASAVAPSRASGVFSSHLSTVLIAMAIRARGVAYAPLSYVENEIRFGSLLRLGEPCDEVPVEIHLARLQTHASPKVESIWSEARKAGKTEASLLYANHGNC